MRSVAPGSILDVGCGEGVVTERLARSTGAATTGVDLGTPELEAHWRRREGDGISFRAASTYDLPFDHDSFDCVCAIEVLEHLERPRDALAELARVSQGAMLLSVPREPLWRMAHLAAGRDVRSLGNTPGHINHWSSRRFRSLVAEFGHVLAVVRPHPWTVVLARPHTLAERPHGGAPERGRDLPGAVETRAAPHTGAAARVSKRPSWP